MHGDDFIFVGDFAQLMWIESRLKEGLNFERCVDLGVDDGVTDRYFTFADEHGRN